MAQVKQVVETIRYINSFEDLADTMKTISSSNNNHHVTSLIFDGKIFQGKPYSLKQGEKPDISCNDCSDFIYAPRVFDSLIEKLQNNRHRFVTQMESSITTLTIEWTVKD
jgi:hypothetical protein